MRLRSPWQPWLDDASTSPADRLAGALADDILQGKLEAGARLPPHRDLADALGIALGTVTKAFAVLERRGLVRPERGRGTFVALTQSRKGVQIDLSWNIPPSATTGRILARTLGAVAKRVDAGLFNDYPPLGGHAEHRRLLARWFASIGMEADPDCLLLTNGALHALSLAFATACGTGGTLLTEAETYPGVLRLASHYGLKVVGVAMDDEGMLPDALARALASAQGGRAAVCVTPTMQNPTTATMRRGRRDAIVAVCREHDAAIVEDDVYNLGVERELVPLAMLAPERTFYVNSISKSLNPTLRIGGLAVPPAAMEAALASLRTMPNLVSPLSCAVMEQWLLDGTAEAVCSAIQHEAAQRVKLAVSLLGERVRMPVYPGYHLWMPMARAEAERVHAAAATFGIQLTPPSATAAAPHARHSGLRLCIGAAGLDDVSAALSTLARLVSVEAPI